MSLTDPLGLRRKRNRKKKTEHFEPQWKSDIEQRELEFTLKTATIRFNKPANYVIKFILVESFTDKYDGVLIKVDESDFTEGHVYSSEFIEPVEIGNRQPFEHSVSFILPKGYCKNDGRHDVHIRMEAWEASKRGADVKLTKLVGQSIYPVYPRPKHPLINLNAKNGEAMLRETVVLPLLRTANTDQNVMHCGDVAFSVKIMDRTFGRGGWQSTDIPAIRVESASNMGDLTERTGGATSVLSQVPPSPVPTIGYSDPKNKHRASDVFSLAEQQGGKRESNASFAGNNQRPSNASMYPPKTNQSKLKDDALFSDIPEFSEPQSRDHDISLKASDSEEELLKVSPEKNATKRKQSSGQTRFKSLHDVKFLKPDAFGKAVSDTGGSIFSQMSHVSHPGMEKFDVLVHSVCSLPQRSADQNLPRPFVAVSTTMGFLHNEIQSFTHVSKNSGICGTWAELCFAEFDGVTITNEALVLAIVDKETLEIMAVYSIPVTYFTPYHQYHLELNLPRRHGVNCRLYVSIMRKLPQIPHEQMGPIYGVEALVQNFETPLNSDPGPLICVARIIPDYSRYIPISRQHSLFGVIPRRITFPFPKQGSFIESEKVSIGNPQVSVPSEKAGHPHWNYPFLFASSRDKATVFTPGAALLLEYYQFFMQNSEAGWQLKNPVAFSLIPLDTRTFDLISKSATSLGVVVRGVPVLSQNLRNTQGKTPTISVALRLLSPHATDTLASQSRAILESLPLIDIHPFIHELQLNCKNMGFKYTSPCPGEESKPKSAQIMAHSDSLSSTKIMHLVPKNLKAEDIVEEYRVKVLTEKLPRPPLDLKLEDGELPPANAMQSVLPEYRYLLEGGRGGRHAHILRQMGDDPANLMGDSNRRASDLKPAMSPVPFNGYAGSTGLNSILVPVQADAMAVAELDQYRRAVRRMGEDILALRREMANMSQENSKLANQLAHYDELSRTVVSTQVIEGLSKAELADRYVASRQQLIQQEEQLQQYKARTQKLQNELIKKNDREVEGAHIRQAHAAQQAIIQRLQDKAARYDKLVETVRHQELVIERMERVLTTRLKAIPIGDSVDVNNVQREAYDSVVEENTQLRRQIEEMRIINEATGVAQGEIDAERLQMMQAMDRMEARIVALEKELEDRSREWGRERAELVIKLNEQHRGFSPTKQLSPTRISPTSPPRFSGGGITSIRRFQVAESTTVPQTAFPALAAARQPMGVGGTLLGRGRFGGQS